MHASIGHQSFARDSTGGARTYVELWHFVAVALRRVGEPRTNRQGVLARYAARQLERSEREAAVTQSVAECEQRFVRLIEPLRLVVPALTDVRPAVRWGVAMDGQPA